MTPPLGPQVAIATALGSLEFKAEDFDKTRCLFNRMSDFAWKGVTAVLRDEANALLAERLGELMYNVEWNRECDCCNNNRALVEKLEGK